MTNTILSNETQVQARPVWYELLTSDMQAAERFYRAVVGWNVTPFDRSPVPYDMWTRDGGIPVGGVMAQQAGAPSHWLMYVGVPQIETAAARVQSLGGSTISPVIEIPSVGRSQVVADPQGAVFALHEPPPGSPETPDSPPGLGAVSWHELHTSDVATALQFYSAAFGWRETQAIDMGPMLGKYHIFGGERDLGGMMKSAEPLRKVPAAWLLYFRVGDVKSAVERVDANGGQILDGPIEVPGGDLVANCMDPQGAPFSLQERRA